MGAGAALLDPADVQGGGGEVDLIPAQVGQLAGPEPMPIGHKDHRSVPVRPSVALRGPQQPFDLGLRQVLAGAQVGVGESSGCDCSFFGGWRDEPELRFGQGFVPLREYTVRIITQKRTVLQSADEGAVKGDTIAAPLRMGPKPIRVVPPTQGVRRSHANRMSD